MICYGLGNLSFSTGHGGRKHENWIGLVVELALGERSERTFKLRFVRHNDADETVFRHPADETGTLADLTARSAKLATKLMPNGDCVEIAL